MATTRPTTVSQADSALQCFRQAADHARTIGDEAVARAAKFKATCDALAGDFERRSDALGAVVAAEAELGTELAEAVKVLRERLNIDKPQVVNGAGYAAVETALRQDHQGERVPS